MKGNEQVDRQTSMSLFTHTKQTLTNISIFTCTQRTMTGMSLFTHTKQTMTGISVSHIYPPHPPSTHTHTHINTKQTRF